MAFVGERHRREDPQAATQHQPVEARMPARWLQCSWLHLVMVGNGRALGMYPAGAEAVDFFDQHAGSVKP
jgi:hypothetical protein